MSKTHILYVSSEISPFLQSTSVANLVGKLPQAMQERGMEIRILVPRFGSINERKNRLHEVVRLSGINITMGDEEKPLVIKVASIPTAKLQVYFIDNEDYFHRKSVFHDKENNFYADNDDRAIFFCKGALETVRKLGWSPNIIHCNDWMTSFIPLYVKTTYRKDPLFKKSKVLFTLYDNSFNHKFSHANLAEKIKMMDVEETHLSGLKSGDFESFIKCGGHYADIVSFSGENKKIENLLKKIKDKKIESVSPDDAFVENYHKLYAELAK